MTENTDNFDITVIAHCTVYVHILNMSGLNIEIEAIEFCKLKELIFFTYWNICYILHCTGCFLILLFYDSGTIQHRLNHYVLHLLNNSGCFWSAPPENIIFGEIKKILFPRFSLRIILKSINKLLRTFLES